jgi:chitinase
MLLFVAACVGPLDKASTPVRHSGALRTQTRFVYSPYKHVPISLSPEHVLATAAGGATSPIVEGDRSKLPAGVTALTLAFATGECGAESWDGMQPGEWVAANVAALDRADIDYIVSTGGEAGTFTCSTDAGMEAFIARYASKHLVGLDFDIERGQSDEILQSLALRIAAAQQRHPELRISFTLATWAATDGSFASLNADGERVMGAVRAAGIDDFYVNLMVMDYGEAVPRNCVVSAGVCDMGRSAIQAARNLNARHGVPYDRIELTPMLGVNDVTANVFTVEDAWFVGRFVRESGLGGLHFWSLDRDAPCPGRASGVSSACSGLAAPPFAFNAAFRDGLR